eukprot:m.86705 g.86705  ORF g.86705 m.86705 type:complete len:494 (+) comp13066_c0_seq1:116-1597(+)
MGEKGRTYALQLIPPRSRINVFAFLIGIGGSLLGYDIGSISGILEMQEFKDLFIHDNLWAKGFIVTALVIGATVGSLSSSFISDYFGRKNGMGVACIVFIAGAAGQTFASTNDVLYASRMISGFGIGVTSAVAPLYNSEVAPKEIRGKLVTYNQLAMTGGIMIAFWINYALQHVHNGWRIAMAIQAVPALILLVACFFLPPSPRWLVKHNKLGRASESLRALRCVKGTTTLPVEVAMELAEIEESIAYERLTRPELWANFLIEPSVRRRAFTACLLQSFQQLTGINSIMYYAPSIFASIGFRDSALMAQGINGVLNFLATFLAFYLVDRYGRKSLLITGSCLMGLSMGLLAALGSAFAVGTAEDLHITPKYVGFISISCIYLFVVSFAFSWGPVVWLMCTELFGTSQRSRGVSLSTATNWAWNIVIAQFVPILQDQLQWDLFSIFGGFCLVMTLFVCVFVPETKSMSLEEIQSYFNSGKLPNPDPEKLRLNGE